MKLASRSFTSVGFFPPQKFLEHLVPAPVTDGKTGRRDRDKAQCRPWGWGELRLMVSVCGHLPVVGPHRRGRRWAPGVGGGSKCGSILRGSRMTSRILVCSGERLGSEFAAGDSESIPLGTAVGIEKGELCCLQKQRRGWERGTQVCVVKGRRRSRQMCRAWCWGSQGGRWRKAGNQGVEGGWWGTCLRAWDLGDLDGALAASLRALGQVSSLPWTSVSPM